MRAILDGDLLAYECSFGASVSWKAITGEDAIPPFSHVEKLLLERIEFIMLQAGADDATIYITEGRTFRFDIAKTKAYKANRKNEKPFHHKNIMAYLKGQLGAKSIPNLEADDSMAIDHVNSEDDTILCSRDKDLMSIPGMFYRWELGKGSSWGPNLITKEGWLSLNREKNTPKLTGAGDSWFFAQLLMGDTVDNIPGCPGVGCVAAYNLLNDKTPDEQLENVINEYKKAYEIEWEKMLMEQAALVYIVRELDQHQQPVMWQLPASKTLTASTSSTTHSDTR